MDEFINPIEVLGPVQCRNCGNDMSLIITSADGINLDHDGNPEDMINLIEESYMLCKRCGYTSDYSINPKTLSYKIINPIDSFGNQSEEAMEEFDMICNEMNPFHLRDEMKCNNELNNKN